LKHSTKNSTATLERVPRKLKLRRELMLSRRSFPKLMTRELLEKTLSKRSGLDTQNSTKKKERQESTKKSRLPSPKARRKASET